MKLISPIFLKKIKKDSEKIIQKLSRERGLFKEILYLSDVLDMVMESLDMGFEEAVEWISLNYYGYEAPMADEKEYVKMQKSVRDLIKDVAKEMGKDINI